METLNITSTGLRPTLYLHSDFLLSQTCMSAYKLSTQHLHLYIPPSVYPSTSQTLCPKLNSWLIFSPNHLSPQFSPLTYYQLSIPMFCSLGPKILDFSLHLIIYINLPENFICFLKIYIPWTLFIIIISSLLGFLQWLLPLPALLSGSPKAPYPSLCSPSTSRVLPRSTLCNVPIPLCRAFKVPSLCPLLGLFFYTHLLAIPFSGPLMSSFLCLECASQTHSQGSLICSHPLKCCSIVIFS